MSRYTEDELEEQFQVFLKQSVSSDESFDTLQKKASEIARVNRKKNIQPWWMGDEKDEPTIGLGLSSSGKSFLKSKKSPLPEKKASGIAKSSKGKKLSNQASAKIKSRLDKTKSRKKDVSPKRNIHSKTEASMSKDSLEDISEKSEGNDMADALRIRGLDSSADTTRDSTTTDQFESPGRPGMDTLDELADKQRFYKEVEADGTIDYGQLNRELSQTGMTISPEMAARSGVMTNKSAQLNVNKSNNVALQHRGKEDNKESLVIKPSMLSKVSLLDSLDSTLNTTTSPKASIPVDGSKDVTRDNLSQTLPDTLKTGTGTGMIGTNTSREIEALHEALREVGMSPTIKLDDPLTGDGLPDTDNRTEKPVRTVGEIFREMNVVEQRVKVNENQESDIRLRSDYQSPRSHSSGSPFSLGKGLSRQQHFDDVQHGGYDQSHTDDTEVYQPITSVSVIDKKSLHKADSVATPEKTDVKDKRSRSRYSHIQSSGYGKRSPTRSSSHSPLRSLERSPIRSPIRLSRKQGHLGGKSQTWSPAEVSSYNVKGSQSAVSAQYDLSGSKVANSRLMQSVESFAGYIREHFTGKDLPQAQYPYEEPAVSTSLERGTSIDKQLRDALNQEKENKSKLQQEMLSLQQHHQEDTDQLKVAHEQEMFKLKQENFVLSAQVQDNLTPARKKMAEVLSGDMVTREQLTMLEQEIKQQESLIAGYQTENQRLYDEMKTLKSRTRTTEQKMFAENQRLVTEVTNLKSQLEQKDLALRNKGIITSLAIQQQIATGNADSKLISSKVTELTSDLKDAMMKIDMLEREVKVYQQSKFELDQQIHHLIKERSDSNKQLDDAKKATPEQIRILKHDHSEELSKLTRKIKWYAENQDLLDKNINNLRKKDDVIRELKLKLEGVTSEAGKKLEENKLRSKERSADAKKIQDLQRQVKEMEQIMRRRYPNSLPALMLAAAAVPDNALGSKLESTKVLEERIKKLESDLSKKDEESNTLLRSLEQKYNSVKFKFESHIDNLEKQLSIYQQPDSVIPGSLIERQLNDLQIRYQTQLTGLQSEVNRLTGELTKVNKNQHNLMKNESVLLESDLSHQVAQLQQELEVKKHDLDILHTSMQKLSTGKSKNSAKNPKRKSKKDEAQLAHFPTNLLNGRNYEPQIFADSDVTDMIQENEVLKLKVDQLQLELDQQRVDLRKSLAHTEANARHSREDFEDQIVSLRHSHQEDLQKVLSNQALQHSTSKLAQLHSKCDTQEVMIRHLQEQLVKSEVDAEQISVLRIQLLTKENQIDQLQGLLQEAKKSHSPEMRHFESLQEKIILLEKRHEQRETELKQIISNTQQVASRELEQEVTKWRRVVDIKNSEIQTFRAELDSILDVLRVLQKQGVVMPTAYH